MLGAILVDRKRWKGLVGVAVVAGAVFPVCVKDICIALMEREFAACCCEEVVVELDVGLGLGVYCIVFGNW